MRSARSVHLLVATVGPFRRGSHLSAPSAFRGEDSGVCTRWGGCHRPRDCPFVPSGRLRGRPPSGGPGCERGITVLGRSGARVRVTPLCNMPAVPADAFAPGRPPRSVRCRPVCGGVPRAGGPADSSSCGGAEATPQPLTCGECLDRTPTPAHHRCPTLRRADPARLLSGILKPTSRLHVCFLNSTGSIQEVADRVHGFGLVREGGCLGKAVHGLRCRARFLPDGSDPCV